MFELEMKIVELINQSELPLEAKFYVVQAVTNKLKEAYNDAIRKQQIEKEAKPDEQMPHNDNMDQ